MLPGIVLTTDRLTLRPPVEGDFDAVSAFMASDRTAFIGGKTDDEMMRWRGFLSAAGHWAIKGFGYFTLLRGGAPVGRAGIVAHRVAWAEPELGWHLFDGHERQGYATEAARAIRAWAWAERGLGPLISYIDPANARSQGVARRLGARVEGTQYLLGTRVDIWRHPDPAGAAA